MGKLLRGEIGSPEAWPRGSLSHGVRLGASHRPYNLRYHPGTSSFGPAGIDVRSTEDMVTSQRPAAAIKGALPLLFHLDP